MFRKLLTLFQVFVSLFKIFTKIRDRKAELKTFDKNKLVESIINYSQCAVKCLVMHFKLYKDF